MSIVAFKKKSVIKHGSKRSGRAPGGEFVTQGPFGLKNGNMLENTAKSNVAFAPNGFSLVGTHRNVGYVGQNMAMSKSGTPFRGVYPVGNGGCCNQYATPLPTMNSLQAETKGNEYLYVKPSVLSQRGMLRKKFKYLYNGQYPNYIVKESFTGDQVDNASQGVYLSKVSAANAIYQDINQTEKFEGFKKLCGPTDCQTSTANFRYNTMAANAPYTKTTKNPIDSSAYTLYVKQQCATSDCDPAKKPFPKPTNGNGGPCALPISSVLL